MEIGDKVLLKGQIYGFKNRDKRFTRHIEMKPLRAVYLGKSTLQEGEVIRDYGWENPAYLKVGKVVSVLVFQPLTGQRYRKPIYALPEDVVS